MSRQEYVSGIARRQQVLQIIQADPLHSLQSIADKVGVTRERVRQICIQLKEAGVIEDRCELKRRAIEKKEADAQQESEAKIEIRRHRKRIWHRMTYIGQRLRLRHAAGLDRHGMSHGYHMPGIEVTCQFSGCNRPVDARGFCSSHYAKLRYTGSLWVCRRSRRTCKEPDCCMPTFARDMCHNHYCRFIRKNPVGRGLKAHNTSGYHGVSWRKTDQGWGAYIHPTSGKQKYLGTFDSKEAAARAYDTAARHYFGEKAKLNFPNENVDVVRRSRKVAGKVSGIPGVTWYSRKSRWVVRITRHGKNIYAGSFIDIEDAITARNVALNARQP